MSEGKNFMNPFNEYRFPVNETGKGRAITFNPDENPNGEEFAARFNAVAATKPASIAEFLQRIAAMDKQEG